MTRLWQLLTTDGDTWPLSECGASACSELTEFVQPGCLLSLEEMMLRKESGLHLHYSLVKETLRKMFNSRQQAGLRNASR